jgi:hypothetical protein
VKLAVRGEDRAVGRDHGERADPFQVPQLGPDVDVHAHGDVINLIDTQVFQITDDQLIIWEIGDK